MTHTLKTFKSFAWNHLSKLTEYGLTYIFGILLARKLGADNYSVYVTLISISSLSMIFGGLGFDETLNRFIPQLSYENKILFVRSLVKKLLFIRTGLLSILAIILIVFRSNLASLLNNNILADYILYLSLYIILQSVVNFFSNIFISQLMTKSVFIINFSTKLVTLLIGLYVLNLGYGVKEIIILLLIISFLAVALYLAIGGYDYLFKESERYNSINAIKFGITNWANLILSFLLGKNSNILIISTLIGSTIQISYYEIAFSFTQLIEYFFSIGFMGVALSSFSGLAVSDSTKMKYLRSSIMKYLQLFNIPISLLVFFNAGFIIPLIFSREYVASVQLLKIFLIFNTISISLLGSGTNTAILLSIGKEKISLFIRLFCAILNIALLVIFVPIYGVSGAIFITGLCLFLTVLSEFIYATKFVGIEYDVNFLLKVISVSAISLLVSEILKDYLSINSIISIIIYILLVGAGYVVFRIFTREFKTFLSFFNLSAFTRRK